MAQPEAGEHFRSAVSASIIDYDEGRAVRQQIERAVDGCDTGTDPSDLVEGGNDDSEARLAELGHGREY
jgi:hypothetical protein